MERCLSYKSCLKALESCDYHRVHRKTTEKQSLLLTDNTADVTLSTVARGQVLCGRAAMQSQSHGEVLCYQELFESS